MQGQHICGHQVPRNEGCHPSRRGHGREAGWPGHSKDTHRAGRALLGGPGRGGREEGTAVSKCTWLAGSAFQNGLRAGGRVSFREKSRRRLLVCWHRRGDPPVPHVSTAQRPPACLRVQVQEPLVALAPRGWGQGRGWCMPGWGPTTRPPFHNRSQKPPQSQCSGHRLPHHLVNPTGPWG